MGMNIGSGGGDEDEVVSAINTTPLVDVMLVLLIIFLIAVPIATQTIEKLRMPIMVSQESKDKVENLLLTISSTDNGGRSAGEPGFEAERDHFDAAQVGTEHPNRDAAIDVVGAQHGERVGMHAAHEDIDGRARQRGGHARMLLCQPP